MVSALPERHAAMCAGRLAGACGGAEVCAPGGITTRIGCCAPRALVCDFKFKMLGREEARSAAGELECGARREMIGAYPLVAYPAGYLKI